MNRSIRSFPAAAAILALAALASCLSPERRYALLLDDPSGLSVEVAPGMPGGLHLRDPRVRSLEGGASEVQVTIENGGLVERRVEIQTEWYDEAGFQLDDVASGWEPITIGGRGLAYLRRAAPNDRARRLVIHLRARDEVR